MKNKSLENTHQIEVCLWATRIGAEDWQEDLITCTSDQSKLERATEWAKSNGFDRIRLSVFDAGSLPDWAATIN